MIILLIVLLILLVIVLLKINSLKEDIQILSEKNRAHHQALQHILDAVNAITERINQSNPSDEDNELNDSPAATIIENSIPIIQEVADEVPEVVNENVALPVDEPFEEVLHPNDAASANLDANISHNDEMPVQEIAAMTASDMHNPIRKPSWWQRFRDQNPDVEKFIGENLINKIGILILVLGISFFVKYAIDKEWISEPLRVGIGILAGSILLGVAHRLRANFKAFSTVFVAGAISVYYFTIAIAFHDYHLFSQTAAFIIMIGIMLFSVFVALGYNRQELMVMATVGGFLVPFLVSTGAGNFNVLFIYLIILNLGILTIAYFRKWFVVNFVGFVLTTIIVSALLGMQIDATNYMPALRYSAVFYLIFSVAFLLNSLINKVKVTYFDISAFLLNTVVFYAIGMYTLGDTAPSYRGLFTFILSAYNLAIAFVLYRKYKFDFNIIYIVIGISLSLATITIPIQFSGNYISLFWSAEALMLLWLSKQTRMKGFALSSLIVLVLAVFSYVMDLQKYGSNNVAGPIVINKLCITGLVLLASVIAQRIIIKRFELLELWLTKLTLHPKSYSTILEILAVLLGYFVPLLDINYHSGYTFDNYVTRFVFGYLFHFIYTTALIWYIRKYRMNYAFITYILVIINTLAYVLLIALSSKEEYEVYLFGKETYYSYALWLQILILSAYVYQLFMVHKMLQSENLIPTQRAKILPWVYGFLTVFAASCLVQSFVLRNAVDIDHYFDLENLTIRVVYPIVWGIVSFVLLIWGIKKNQKMMRIVALVLLGITIIKLFVYDIQSASESGKIIAFILLGVLILIISFVYQKIKKIVNNETEQ